MEHDLGKPRVDTWKVLKDLNQGTRESGSINCRLDVDKFTSYYRTLWNGTNYGEQNWNSNSKDDYEGYEIEREQLENILKEVKNGGASGEDNMASEMLNTLQKNLKQVSFKILMQFV